jgi:DnaJ-class molecular chaperone
MNLREAYILLELKENASDEEIKKAYKKMAVKWHPDKNPDNKDDAESKFKEVAQAYELINKSKYNNCETFRNANFRSGNIDPNDLFNKMFREMNIVQNSFNTNINTRVNISGFQGFQGVAGFSGMQNMRSSSITISGDKKIEKIKEVKNGISSEKTIITNLRTGEKEIFDEQNRKLN